MDRIHGAQGAGPSTPTAADGSATASSKTRQNALPQATDTGDADRKHFATLQARAALAGVALSRTEDDRGREVFLASKWAMTKELASLAEVEDLLVRIGGQHAG